MHLRIVATAAFGLIAALFASVAASARGDAAALRPEVLVVGGTPAGVAAALAAARRGETTTLVSAQDDLGGVLVDGMMDQWDLNVARDGAPVERGIFAEMYARLGEAFEPEAGASAFAKMLAEQPRVALRYDAVPVSVDVVVAADGRRLDGVTFHDARSGAFYTVRAPFVVDATDFGDVAALAGARYDLGRQDTGIDERMQAVTEMFTIEGVDWGAVESNYDPSRFGPGGATDRSAWGYARVMRGYRPAGADLVVRDLNFGRLPDGSVTANAVDVVGVDGLDPAQLEEARRDTMLEAPPLVGYLRSRLPGFERARVGRFAPDVYVRETRHFAGLELLTAKDIWLGTVPPDSIGLASYPLDVHPVDASDEPAFAPTRHVYGVPFGALIPRGFVNLVLAGPAISATHLAAGSARTVPTTVEEGEAAGAAAALAERRRIDILQLATQPDGVAQLRADLAANGAIVAEPKHMKVA